MRSDARSEPASGSLKSWHHISVALEDRSEPRRLLLRVPCCISVGPTMPMATANTPTDTPHLACSSAKIASSIGLAAPAAERTRAS